MEGFIIVLVVTAWFVATVTSFHLAVVRGSYCWFLVGISLVVAAMGLVVQKEIDKENKGRCLAYEERSVYDSALKTMRKADVCVERGVWKE